MLEQVETSTPTVKPVLVATCQYAVKVRRHKPWSGGPLSWIPGMWFTLCQFRLSISLAMAQPSHIKLWNLQYCCSCAVVMCEPRNRDNGASDVWALTAYSGHLLHAPLKFPPEKIISMWKTLWIYSGRLSIMATISVSLEWPLLAGLTVDCRKIKKKEWLISSCIKTVEMFATLTSTH